MNKNITNPTDISKKINRSLNEGEKIFNLNLYTKIKTTSPILTSKDAKKKRHLSPKRKKLKVKK